MLNVLNWFPARPGALLVAGGSLVLLAGAFAFQYLGGLPPCVLCIWQRYPHGVAALLCLGAGFLPATMGGRLTGTGLTGVAGLVLLTGAGIAAFHVGVELHWWEGTAECGTAGGPASSVAELRARLMETPMVRCDEIAWSAFGVSMAGWNLLLSVALAALSFLVACRFYREASE